MAEEPKDLKEKKVTITQGQLDQLLGTIEKLTKGQELLFGVADKNRLARAQALTGEELIRTAKVSMYDGKYVVGWVLTKNTSEILPGTGRWVEDQETTLVFEDGTTHAMPLIEFYRKIQKVAGDIISQNEQYDALTKQKVTIFTIEFKDGKQLTIDTRFIN
jgi:hypothetical protein